MSDTAMANDQQIAAKVHPLVAFRQRLDARTNELKMALPAHISPERFIRVVVTAAQINPDILACEFTSVWNACMKACNDGLLPDGVEGAIVPYGSKAQWIPMVQGYLKRFRNSGQFKHVSVGICREGDQYDHWEDENGPHFNFRRKHGNDAAPIIWVWATAKTISDQFFIEEMSLDQVNKRKAMSRGTRDDAPWKKWPEEMMKKTVLKALTKYLPKSSDVDLLLKRDEEALLGVESIEDTRQAFAERPSAQAVLDQFAGESTKQHLQSAAEPSDEPDATDSPTGTDAEPARSDAAGKAPDSVAGTGAGEAAGDASPPAAELPKNPAEYFAMVEAKAAAAESIGDAEHLMPWFVSDQQRKLRNSIGMVSEETKQARTVLEQRVHQLRP
jgi:recombination protein RecT